MVFAIRQITGTFSISYTSVRALVTYAIVFSPDHGIRVAGRDGLPERTLYCCYCGRPADDFV